MTSIMALASNQGSPFLQDLRMADLECETAFSAIEAWPDSKVVSEAACRFLNISMEMGDNLRQGVTQEEMTDLHWKLYYYERIFDEIQQIETVIFSFEDPALSTVEMISMLAVARSRGKTIVGYMPTYYTETTSSAILHLADKVVVGENLRTA